MKWNIAIVCLLFVTGCSSCGNRREIPRDGRSRDTAMKETRIHTPERRTVTPGNLLTEPDMLPREIEVPGWRLLADDEAPGGDTFPGYVYDYYGGSMRERISAWYNSYSNDMLFACAEVVTCDTPRNAFGMFSLERKAEEGVEHRSDTVYSSREGIFAVKGVYYIRIVYGIGEGSEKGTGEHRRFLLPFLEVIMAKLNERKGAMESFQPDLLFGQGGFRQVVYYANGHPLLPAISPCYVEDMALKGDHREVIYADMGDIQTATDLLNTLLAHGNSGFSLSSGDDRFIAVKKRNDGHFIIITLQKQWIFGILDADDIHSGYTVISELRERSLMKPHR